MPAIADVLFLSGVRVTKRGHSFTTTYEEPSHRQSGRSLRFALFFFLSHGFTIQIRFVGTLPTFHLLPAQAGQFVIRQYA